MIRSLTILALLLAAAVASAQAPRTLSVQGLLADAAGRPLPNGSHLVTLRLHETPNGGAALFEESVNVATEGGVFSTLLGASGGGIPAEIPFDRPYFLGIAVGGGAELLPRIELSAVPYALHAATAAQASSLAPDAAGAVTALNGLTGALAIDGEGGTTVRTEGGRIVISTAGATGEATGDLAGSYPAPQIAPGAVSGAKIADRGVGLAKISTSGADAGDVIGFDGERIVWRPDGAGFPMAATIRTTTSAIALTDSTRGPAQPLVRFDVRDSASGRTALEVVQNGAGVNAITAKASGGGSAAFFSKSVDRGTGSGGTFIGPVLVASALQGSRVSAAVFNAHDTTNTRPAVDIEQRGTGVGLQVDAAGANIATFRRRRATANGGSSTSTVVRFDSTGKGFFDGGTQAGGADLAEAFDVEGDRAAYEPGDVLAISTSRTRRVALSSGAYSTLVAGVYATKPGVLLTEHGNEASLDAMVPMGVVGVIPTKVTAENGPIAIGDLVVASSTPGHAMKGDPAVAKEHPGCVVGKALEAFDAGGRGMILVLVSVR